MVPMVPDLPESLTSADNLAGEGTFAQNRTKNVKHFSTNDMAPCCLEFQRHLQQVCWGLCWLSSAEILILADFVTDSMLFFSGLHVWCTSCSLNISLEYFCLKYNQNKMVTTPRMRKSNEKNAKVRKLCALCGTV